jgi:small subunit ribosomal protein S16
MKAAASEPAEGATTLKKKAQEKLAAKANPVAETVVAEEAPAVSEPVAHDAVAEVPAVEATADAVVETEAAAE